MKLIYTYIFILVFAALCSSQTIFSKVRLNMFDEAAFKNSLTKLDSCINKNYLKDSAIYYKGIIYVKLNNLKEATTNYNLLIKTFPAFVEAHFLGGLIYCSQKNYGKSINEFTAIIEKYPNHLRALYNRSIAFGLSYNYKKAIEDLNTCISIKPMYSQAYYSRAYWLEFLGDYIKAAKDYETTINLDPKNFDAYFGLASIYRNQNEKIKSCEVINDAIKSGSQVAEDLKENFCR